MYLHFIKGLLYCSIITVTQIQGNRLAENGIYTSDADFIHHKLTMPFGKAKNSDTSFKEPLGHYDQLWIKTKDSVCKFYISDLWGYRKNGKDYRIVQNDPYQISYAGKVIIYNITSSPGVGKGSTVFFSKSISSPVHELSRKKLLEVYYNESSFVEKIKALKWYQSIYKWNKGAGHYVFVDWIN